MTQTNEFIKDPEAVLDYKFDFKPLTHGVYLAVSDYLSTSETIVSATVTGETGIVVDSYAITEAGTSVTAWISGGTAGKSYKVTCHIHTSIPSRVDDRTIIVRVRQR
jgi:hypothetical protein